MLMNKNFLASFKAFGETFAKLGKLGAKRESQTVTVDVFKNKAFVFKGAVLMPKEYSSISSKDKNIITYVKNRELLNTKIDASANANKEELETFILDAAYKNLGLEASKQYLCAYTPREEQENIYDAFLIDADVLENNLQALLYNTEYIDYIIPEPLLYKGLYKFKVLKSDSVDCFIYIGDDEAYVTVYKQGKFSFVRSLGRYTLNYLNAQYTAVTGERLEKADFLSKLKSNGVSGDMATVIDELLYYISDIFTNLSDISNANISRIFIGTDIGNIDGLAALATTRIGISCKDFDFNLNFEGRDLDVNFLNTLMLLYTKGFSDERHAANLSPYLRPPAFIKRDGGKFIACVGAGLIAGLVLPGIELAQAGFNTASKETYQFRADSLNSDLTPLRNTKAENEKKLKEQKEQLDKLIADLAIRNKILQDSYAKKVTYKMKSTTLYDIAKFINEQGVSTESIKIDGDNEIEVRLNGSNDVKITKLIKAIDHSEKYVVTAKEIIFENGAYKSSITIKAK